MPDSFHSIRAWLLCICVMISGVYCACARAASPDLGHQSPRPGCCQGCHASKSRRSGHQSSGACTHCTGAYASEKTPSTDVTPHADQVAPDFTVHLFTAVPCPRPFWSSPQTAAPPPGDGRTLLRLHCALVV